MNDTTAPLAWCIVSVLSDVDNSLLLNRILLTRHPAVRFRSCVSVSHALEVLQMLEQVPERSLPSLVLLDEHIPSADATALIRFLRRSATYASAPVIILTRSGGSCPLAQAIDLPDDRTRPMPSSWDGWCTLGDLLLATLSAVSQDTATGSTPPPGLRQHLHQERSDPRFATTIMLPPTGSSSPGQ